MTFASLIAFFCTVTFSFANYIATDRDGYKKIDHLKICFNDFPSIFKPNFLKLIHGFTLSGIFLHLLFIKIGEIMLISHILSIFTNLLLLCTGMSPTFYWKFSVFMYVKSLFCRIAAVCNFISENAPIKDF